MVHGVRGRRPRQLDAATARAGTDREARGDLRRGREGDRRGGALPPSPLSLRSLADVGQRSLLLRNGHRFPQTQRSRRRFRPEVDLEGFGQRDRAAGTVEDAAQRRGWQSDVVDGQGLQGAGADLHQGFCRRPGHVQRRNGQWAVRAGDELRSRLDRFPGAEEWQGDDFRLRGILERRRAERLECELGRAVEFPPFR